MPGASSLRWVVSVSQPKGDFTDGVDRRWIESFVVTASSPPSAASVVFVEDVPAEVVEKVADQARTGGSGDVVVAQQVWPADTAEARGMTVEAVDERDSGWEHHAPVFRVHVFEESGHVVADDGSSGQGYSTATWDLRGGDVLDAIRWAQDHAGERGLWSVALVADGFQDREGRGLVWLAGIDYQDGPTPETSATLDRMLRRRGRRVVAPE